MFNKEKSFMNERIFCKNEKEVMEILTEAEKQGYKWRSGIEPLKWIPETNYGLGVVLFFDRYNPKTITFLDKRFDEIDFNVIFAKDII